MSAQVIRFDAATHTYTHIASGKAWPSVTQILVQYGDQFTGINPDVLENKRQFGSAVHELCELYDKGEADNVVSHADVLLCLEHYKRFLKHTGAEVLVNEMVVWSDTYRYAGTLDRIYKIHGRNILTDLKTSDSILPTYGPQTAAYENCGSIHLPIHGRATLRLAVDGYKFQEFTDSNDKNVFMSCLTLHRYKEKQK